MNLTGRRIRAEEAADWGLADLVSDDERAAALALASEIAAGAPLAVQATRRTMRGDLFDLVQRQTDHELSEQAWLQKTADFAEGVRAVNERRPGNFTGGVRVAAATLHLTTRRRPGPSWKGKVTARTAD